MNIGNADKKHIEICTVANRIKQIMASAFNKNLNGNNKMLNNLLMYFIFIINFG